MPATPQPNRARRILVGLAAATALPVASLVSAPGAFAAPTSAAVVQAESDPAMTADVTRTDSEVQIHVTGTGYSGEQPGLYVGLTEAGPVDPTNAGAYLGTVWVQASQIKDGSFSIDLDPIPVSDLDSGASYEIHSQKAHGQSVQDPSQNVRLAVDVSGDEGSTEETPGEGSSEGEGQPTEEAPGEGSSEGEGQPTEETPGEEDSDGAGQPADEAGEDVAGEESGDPAAPSDDAGSTGTPETPAVVATDGGEVPEGSDPAALALGGALLLAGLGTGTVAVVRRQHAGSR